MKTMIAMLGMGLLAMGCLGGEQPGPINQEELDGDCTADYQLSEKFTPPESECLILVSEGETRFLRGAFRDRCDVPLKGFQRMQIRWPETASVYVISDTDSFSVEACD